MFHVRLSSPYVWKGWNMPSNEEHLLLMKLLLFNGCNNKHDGIKIMVWVVSLAPMRDILATASLQPRGRSRCPYRSPTYPHSQHLMAIPDHPRCVVIPARVPRWNPRRQRVEPLDIGHVGDRLSRPRSQREAALAAARPSRTHAILWKKNEGEQLCRRGRGQQ